MDKQAEGTAHRSGFVNIVGNPNVGKSTLMNLLVGERISIITSKAQTTRHRIMGIVNTPEMQIVYSDTPGVLRPNYKLQQEMREFSESALGDADVLIYVTDVVEKADKNADFLTRVSRMECPVLLVINKIDLSDQAALEKLVEEWRSVLPLAEIHLGDQQLQRGTPPAPHRESDTTFPSLFREGCAHGQAGTLLRDRDYPRENPPILSEGDPLCCGGRGRRVQGGEVDHPHSGVDHCRARFAEGNHHRTQRSGHQARRLYGSARSGAFL